MNWLRVEPLNLKIVIMRYLRAIVCAIMASATMAIPVNALAASTHARAQPPAWLEFTRAGAGIAGYSATVTVFEPKGAQVQHVVFDYNFRKLSNVTVRVGIGPVMRPAIIVELA